MRAHTTHTDFPGLQGKCIGPVHAVSALGDGAISLAEASPPWIVPPLSYAKHHAQTKQHDDDDDDDDTLNSV